jgi:hypothetical protein
MKLLMNKNMVEQFDACPDVKEPEPCLIISSSLLVNNFIILVTGVFRVVLIAN